MEVNIEELWKKVKGLPNVCGYSGTSKPRIRDGEEIPGTRCFRVYVTEKKTLEKLEPMETIPTTLSGFPTDVVEIGVIQAPPPTTREGREKKEEKDPRKRYRPAPAGCSAIYRDGSACTLGFFARDRKDDEIVIIANNHCTSQENKLRPRYPYVQPSPYDGDPEKLGELKRFVPIEFNEYSCPYRRFLHKLMFWEEKKKNKVDLGIVSAPRQDIKLEILNIGSVEGKRRGEIGELAEKMGRTTKHTREGELVDNDWHGSVRYSRGQAEFGPCGLIEKEGFSGGGDSSSAILWMEDHTFAGLLFAGSQTHTIFCHWDLIEEEGDIEIKI